jgi:hypothetical protein
VNTLPTERDLPPAAREALRARVVDAVGHAPPLRRWVPLAAAAALAAVVCGTAVTVAVARGGPGRTADPAPTATATASRTASPRPTPRFTPIPKRTGPATAATMVADCATYARNSMGDLVQDESPAHLKLLLHDRYGYLIEIVTRRMDATCDMSPTGTVLNGSGGSRDPGLGSELGYVIRPGIAIEVTAYGSDNPAKRIWGAFAAGHVRKGVARVVVTWRGRPPVTAVLDGPFFIARIAVPGEPGPLPPGSAVAYDAAGNELGTSKVFS